MSFFQYSAQKKIEIIYKKLEEKFSPLLIEIQDDSDKHVGHKGSSPNGGTHFTVTIVAKHFQGVSTVNRHKMIYSALETEIKEGIHALSLKVKTPDEFHKST